MSRIIAALCADASLVTAESPRFAAATDFVRRCTRRSSDVQTVSALGGRFRADLVSDSTVGASDDHSSGRNVLVVLDGTPIQDGRRVSAADLLARYLERGVDAAIYDLDGGFAGIIIDERTGQLSLFRDRIGLKPFYYRWDGASLVAGSSAGALVRGGWTPRRVNENMLARYAASNYRAVFGHPTTFFEELRLLPPATIADIGRGAACERRYWEPAEQVSELTLSQDELNEEYRARLRRAVRDHVSACRAERPSIALSGGIDSGTICGLLHEQTNTRVDALSLTYATETEFDETDLMRCSVRDHVADWHNVTLDSDTLLADLPGLYVRLDQPLATVSIYAYDFIYRQAASRGLTSLFTGAGGDALQAGTYPGYLYALADWRVSDPARYETELAWWIRRHSTSQYPKTRDTAETFFEAGLDLSKRGSLRGMALPLAPGVLAGPLEQRAGSLATVPVRSYGSYLRSYAMQEYWYDDVACGSEAEDSMQWTWGMATVSPFFAQRVVEFGLSLPREQKIEHAVNKILARRALVGICSQEILDMVDKKGFNAPFGAWVRGPLRELFMDTVHSARFTTRGVYDIEALGRVVAEHMSETRDHAMLMWQVLNVELWSAEWLDLR